MTASGEDSGRKHIIIVRKKARELALALLFQKEFQTKVVEDKEWSALFDEPLEPEIMEETHRLLRGVEVFQNEIDEDIRKLLINWKLERINFVERNCLRLGFFEMKYAPDPLPHPIVIDEYVNLAKKYGTQDSGGFVNGILDKAAKELSTKKKPNETN